MKHLKTYKIFESSITNILEDTFCDLVDDFPVEVKVGPLHDRVIIRYIEPPQGRDSRGWKTQDLSWLKEILPVIASKINYLSEEEGIDREYCDISIQYERKQSLEQMRVGRLVNRVDGRKFEFEKDIIEDTSLLYVYPVKSIYISWPGFKIQSKINESIPIYNKAIIIDPQMADEINDILLDLDDEGIYCRMWINDPRDENFPSGIKLDEIKEILIEINHEGENADKINTVIGRIKEYLKPKGWELNTSHTEREFDEYRITPITY